MLSTKITEEFNHKLVSFLPSDVLSRFPLNADQIDRYHAYLDWDIMSGKFLPGETFVKYANLIDWNVFLKNGKPKETDYLLYVVDKLEVNREMFFDVRIKKIYYTTSFILTFPQYVDWKWCCKHLKLDDFVILKYWHRFNTNHISKYQIISDNVFKERKKDINWKLASKNKLSECILREMKDMLNWDLVSKKQKLSESFLIEHTDYINWELIAKYQELSVNFITRFIRKLPIKIISKYQDLTAEFIKKFSNVLDFDLLATNKNFNKPDSIQIVKSSNVWFVIDPPMLDKFNLVNFASCESFTENEIKNNIEITIKHKETSLNDYFDNGEENNIEETENENETETDDLEKNIMIEY